MSPFADKRKSEAGKGLALNAEETLAHSLAREVEKDPILGRLIDAWPALPEHTKRTILDLVNAHNR